MTTEQHCPLCGQANQCTLAAGDEQAPCWCFQVQVDPQALARLPDAQQGQRCLCPACAVARPDDQRAER